MKVLAVGLGVTGEAVARFAADRGDVPIVVDDRRAAEVDPVRLRAVEQVVEPAGGRVEFAPDEARWSDLVGESDLVVPSPGVPARHVVYRRAAELGVPLVSEIELASRLLQAPLVAVTGTNGKTTVTTWIARILEASGVGVTVAGNIGRPLLEAAVAGAGDVVVAEVSSFQLQYTREFRPRVAVVLNLADDHLDWHPDFEHYRDAKAQVLANQQPDDVTVLNADDPAVAALAERTRATVVWFSARGAPGAYRLDEHRRLVDPGGEEILAVDALARALPHDVANGLAATAAAEAAGATRPGVRSALRAVSGLPHRLTPVGEAGGVTWYDDSKATNPHAAVAAVLGFESVVLLAGGRNKGLSLDPLATVADRLRAVVAFGEAGAEVAAAFERTSVRVEVVTDVPAAVRAAQRVARPGDAVVLSPACASFDAYPDYAARGDHFAAEVGAVLAPGGAADGDGVPVDGGGRG